MKNTRLFYSALLFTLIIVFWPILAAISIPEGTLRAQVDQLREGLSLYVANFTLALLIAPSLILLLSRYKNAILPDLSGIKSIAGWIFYVIYGILITISYGSQVFYLPHLLSDPESDSLLSWYFLNEGSIAYWLNQTGYLAWSTGTITWFLPGLRRGGLSGFNAAILLLSSLLQFVATLGLYLGIEKLNDLTFYSGILLLPAGILIMILSRKETRIKIASPS